LGSSLPGMVHGSGQRRGMVARTIDGPECKRLLMGNCRRAIAVGKAPSCCKDAGRSSGYQGSHLVVPRRPRASASSCIATMIGAQLGADPPYGQQERTDAPRHLDSVLRSVASQPLLLGAGPGECGPGSSGLLGSCDLLHCLPTLTAARARLTSPCSL